MSWYVRGLKNYFGFRGRARRKEFWLYTLVNTVILYLIWGVGKALDEPRYAFAYGLTVLIPTLAVGVRRLHDSGRSGWWMLLLLAPGIGGIAVLVLCSEAGQPRANAHGPDPKAASQPSEDLTVDPRPT